MLGNYISTFPLSDQMPSDSVEQKQPLGLVLVPVRELGMQIESQAKELIQGVAHMRTALVVGGVPAPPQVHRLQSGVQIVIATPGRLLETLDQSAVDLSFVQILVLDEVDSMLQMGFEHQVCTPKVAHSCCIQIP